MLARTLGRSRALAVSLVDDQRIGQFHDSALDPLQLVARIRQHQHEEEVHHARDLVLRLPHTDRLDEDHVKSGRFAQQHGFARLVCHTAKRALRGRGPDEGSRVTRQRLHARLVAEDAAAGNRRAGVNGQHRNALAAVDEMHAEGFDECGLADPGNTADAHARAVAGMRQNALQKGLGARNVGRERTLDQRYRLGERPAVPGEQQFSTVGAQCATADASMAASTSRADSGMRVPGPKMQLTPASRRKS